MAEGTEANWDTGGDVGPPSFHLDPPVLSSGRRPASSAAALRGASSGPGWAGEWSSV